MRMLVLAATIVCLSITFVVPAQDKPNAKNVEELLQELAQKRGALLGRQIEELGAQIKRLKPGPQKSRALAAQLAILELKRAQLNVKRAQLNVKSALSGARIVADDGRYLGKIASSFDSESIFNTFGEHGSPFSDNSIWNRFGNYGSRFNDLSPFSRFSSKPPKVLLGGAEVASFTVGQTYSSISISPNDLKAVFADE